jgi:PAS domain S-box-containing protein
VTDTDRTHEQLVQELEQLHARVAQLERTVDALSDHAPGIAELELEAIFRALPDLYFRTSLDGTILDYRAGRVTDLYVPPEQFLGKRMQAVLPPEVSRPIESAYQELAQGRPQAIAEYTLKLPGGEKTYEARLLPLGQDQRIILVRDITERRQSEAALRAAEVRYRIVAENTYDWEFWISPAGDFVYSSPSCERITGYTAAEFETDPGLLERIIHPDDLAHYQTHIRETVDTQLPCQVTFRIIRPDGQECWVEHVCQTVLDGEGRFLGKRGSNRDITERKLAEAQLRESEEKYRQLFEMESDAIFLIDNQDGRILEVNEAASALYGFSRDELLRMRNVDLSAQPHETRHAMAQKSTLIPIRYHRKKDGTMFPVEITASHLTWRGRPVHVAAIRDITARLLAEGALRESEQKFRLAFLHNAAGMALVGLDGRFMQVNPSLCQMLDYSEPELLTRTFQGITYPDDRPIGHDLFRQVLAGEREYAWLEKRYVRKDGRLVWVLISSTAIRDDLGHPLYFVSQMQDVTERKDAERILRQANLELETRNEELDAFAHSVAHDLKNPVGLIIGCAEELTHDYATLSNDERQQLVHAIARNGRKTDSIIEELLLLAGVRKAQVESNPLDMAGIVAEALQRLTDVIQQCQAEITLPATWPVALGYAPWVEEVWVNYISNACKYSGHPPRIELGADLLLQAEDSRGMGTVHFWVRDNGAGLSPEEQASLFIPFTRLDQVRVKGYGLGLSIVQRIMEKLDGQAAVESAGMPGQGSTFSFTLPAHYPAPA